jgi:3-oxoacyl-[acyl-carrier protein] reductase
VDLGIRGQVAVVTGAGRGIGSATARLLAQEGCRLVVWDRDREPAETVAAEIRQAGGEALVVTGDVSVRAEVARVAAEIGKAWGAAQILVNNAGFSRDRAILEMSDDDWDAVIDVCLKGVFLCSQAFLPGMIANGYGRIVNIASRAHLGGEPGKTAYSAAKGGVVSFTKALSLEVGKRGVTVNAVAPGFTRTGRLTSLPHFKDIEQRAAAGVHTAVLGEPEDMARAVAFLAAKHNAFIAGDVLYVTGGRYG